MVRNSGKLIKNIIPSRRKKYSSMNAENFEQYLEAMTRDLQIDFQVDPAELAKIPKDGAVLFISNHHFGGIDVLLFLKAISPIRPDIKLVSNSIPRQLENLSGFFLRPGRESNRKINPFRNMFNHLKNQMALCVFPAGDSSSYKIDSRLTDPKWKETYIKFIKNAGVTIIPTYFHGPNTNIFSILIPTHPLLRSIKLPIDLTARKNKTIYLRFGGAISVNEQNEFDDLEKFGRYIRAKIYALGSPLEIKKFFIPSLKREPKEEPIIEGQPKEKIVEEVLRIKEEYLLFKFENYSVICAPTFEMPTVLNEIGRLREITFRDVGEGTNRSIDIDEFDLYYHQLFIWDDEMNQIVGAYRVGKGKDILALYGIKGFYIQSLFRISPEFSPYLSQAIELGRSFIVKDYQRKPMPLFLLWKGILYFLIKNPEYRYLIGPVSISNRFSNFSKTLIIKFLKKNHFNYDMAKYIGSRKEFKVLPKYDTDIVLEKTQNDINKLDKIIADVEITNYRMPVLLKKYLKLNAKLIGFNIDPLFNNALDGLIILDLYEVPMSTIQSLSKEINDASLLDRFIDIDKVTHL